MDWTPLTKAELDTLIASSITETDDAIGELWQRIRIEPVKWRCPPWGDEGGGFWVVAIGAGYVIWYNDIEDGFNASEDIVSGTISRYWCNQDTLRDLLARIVRDPLRETMSGLGSPAKPEQSE